MAAEFKKYDIFSFCREIPNGENARCVQWLWDIYKINSEYFQKE